MKSGDIMYKLSLGMKPEDVLYDLKLVRDEIVDDESYQKADDSLVMSDLDDIIAMCEYAINHGYKKEQE